MSLGESLDTWRKERRPRRCSLRSRDQSLPPNGGLHPHALRSCYSFEPPALASRSRFVVTREICSSLKQLQSGCGSRSRPTGVTATSCFVCVEREDRRDSSHEQARRAGDSAFFQINPKSAPIHHTQQNNTEKKTQKRPKEKEVSRP